MIGCVYGQYAVLKIGENDGGNTVKIVVVYIDRMERGDSLDDVWVSLQFSNFVGVSGPANNSVSFS